MLDPAVLPAGVPGPGVPGPGVSGRGALVRGRYRILERVGRGGMADVYAAEDELLGRPVAVKVFRVDGASGEESRRIDAESRLLASFTHPGLVTVFDAGTCELSGETSPFMVMELVHGPSLRRCLDDGPLGPGPTALLGAELAAALAHVHARGIVHRDVKPANILLTAAPGDGTRASVKLADFGIARALDAARLTTDGSTIGTANYLSPEQVASADVTAASDVYSLGLVLLECLTGSLAYPGAGVQAAVARLHAQPVVPTHFGGRWTGLLTRMTSREPDERPTAAEAATELRALCAGRPPTFADEQDVAGPETQAHTGLAARVPRRRWAEPWSRRRWAAGLGLLPVLVLVSLVLLAARPAHHQAPASAPTYPSVSGTLGVDLRHLEAAVGSGGGATAQLRTDLQVLAASAAAHRYPAAVSALGDLRADLAAAGADGTVSAAQISRVRAAMVPVQQDLMAATAIAAPTATAAATATATATARKAASAAHTTTGAVARTPATTSPVRASVPAKTKPGKGKKDPGPGPHHH
jgi:hypothetical protein